MGSSVTPTQRYMNHRSKCFDIMAKVRDVTGAYYKLDDLLRLNNLSSKIGDGLKAIDMWEKQQRANLVQYCASDVDLTARLALMEKITVDSAQNCTPPCIGLRNTIRTTFPLKKRERVDNEDFVIV